ncbi:hypothetical protein ACNVED_11945 [Legionella sp. D16C41]|uniref:hypothetical protein n=1 Tax=Legionella sp. D16C41 TaxID=3402688 RepID=UPI003AF79A86
MLYRRWIIKIMCLISLLSVIGCARDPITGELKFVKLDPNDNPDIIAAWLIRDYTPYTLPTSSYNTQNDVNTTTAAAVIAVNNIQLVPPPPPPPPSTATIAISGCGNL